MKKRVIFIASSVKNSLSCVAAIDVESKRFLRVVADRSGSAINWRDYEVKGLSGNLLKNLPFLAKIKVLDKVPLNYQQENVLIDKKIEYIRRVSLSELEEYVNYPKSLWGEGGYVKYYNDLKMKYSLFLIKVDKIKLYWKDRGSYSPQRRGVFRYNGIVYDLPLTDPAFEYLEEEILRDRYLIISLGEPFNDKCYKILAKVFK